MSSYRVEWPCCGSATETNAWTPERCPFCEPEASDPPLRAIAAFGALVVARHRGKVEFYGVDGAELDSAEEDSGMTIDGVSLAPGVAEEISRLLASLSAAKGVAP